MILKHLLLCAAITAFFHTAAAAMPERAGNRFSSADTDNNGFLSKAEFSAAFPGLKPEAFAIIDTDRDGRISAGEWRAFTSGHGAKQPAPDGEKPLSPGPALPLLPIPRTSPEPDKAAPERPGSRTDGTLPLLAPPGK